MVDKLIVVGLSPGVVYGFHGNAAFVLPYPYLKIMVIGHAWTKCGIRESHSLEIFTFGGKYLQF